mmetsp:Transcript_43020/g.100957  ORF Transcript_43020/g.100957 Transcript_43020/m.100957 type:complete len:151 (+) Transcript_43020:902-1354(+)
MRSRVAIPRLTSCRTPLGYTTHAVKGLQAKRVFIAGDFLHFPGPNPHVTQIDVNVEANIFFVSLTRAKEHVYVAPQTAAWLAVSEIEPSASEAKSDPAAVAAAAAAALIGRVWQPPWQQPVWQLPPSGAAWQPPPSAFELREQQVRIDTN